MRTFLFRAAMGTLAMLAALDRTFRIAELLMPKGK